MHFDEGRLPDGKVMDAENEKKQKNTRPILTGWIGGGDSWNRTNDLYDVNVAL